MKMASPYNPMIFYEFLKMFYDFLRMFLHWSPKKCKNAIILPLKIIKNTGSIALIENPPGWGTKFKAREAPGGRVTKSNLKRSLLRTQTRYEALALHGKN